MRVREEGWRPTVDPLRHHQHLGEEMDRGDEGGLLARQEQERRTERGGLHKQARRDSSSLEFTMLGGDSPPKKERMSGEDLSAIAKTSVTTHWSVFERSTAVKKTKQERYLITQKYMLGRPAQKDLIC